MLIADAHTDLLLELAYRDHRLGETGTFAATWLPVLEQGEVGLQVCPVYVDVTVQPEGSLREALGQVTSFLRAVAENPDRVLQVRSAADLDAVVGRREDRPVAVARGCRAVRRRDLAGRAVPRPRACAWPG